MHCVGDLERFIKFYGKQDQRWCSLFDNFIIFPKKIRFSLKISNAMLNRICNDVNDSMLRVKLQCKHGDLQLVQTSWSEHNPTQRFWCCPRYREDACNFFRWRDRQEVEYDASTLF
ncbi:uncharacterized protein LOC107028148 [Solanum pennellii]|uniref:Uncharacterized protein LOC107028148 n=1 Tax=Solanum pennellii TaxID=28526 RepID=A0ABM1HF68_SOLPN|nr:uncharacterized protein LOC107028148 [Solanum pennellii]